ncbi:hypothetical protein, partial [Escherichia coli]|uniref:hypothetical protein n=1 Tax=Escherichia coli TaxID=562 RepID=UPI00128ED272
MALKRISVVAAVMVVMFLISSCSCTIEENHEDLEREVMGKTEEAKNKATETERKAREESESWAEWAKEKISGLGLKPEDTN